MQIFVLQVSISDFKVYIYIFFLQMREGREGCWPWELPDENDEDEAQPGAAIGAEAKYRYTLTSLNYPKCVF